MVNIKVVVLLIALFVGVAAIAGIASAQYTSAQANSAQVPQGGGYNSYYQGPQQGNYPYGGAQYGNSYGYGYGGMGMGMCGRSW